MEVTDHLNLILAHGQCLDQSDGFAWGEGITDLAFAGWYAEVNKGGSHERRAVAMSTSTVAWKQRLRGISNALNQPVGAGLGLSTEPRVG